MWINEIKLKNVGVYSGDNAFLFNDKKSFNIISGENGHGKTTLLTSIIMCLYGSEMYGSTKFTREYVNRVVDLYSRSASDNIMEISIDFNHQNYNFKFVRSYEMTDNSFIENISYYKNNVLLKDFDINSIISRSYFEFFFFDGETILNTINDNKIHNYINDFIDVAFEFDVFNLLKKDLDKSVNKTLNKLSSVELKQYRKDLSRVDKELLSLESQIKLISSDISVNTTNLKKVEADIKKNGFKTRLEEKSIMSNLETNRQRQTKYNSKINEILKEDINYLLHADLLNKLNTKLSDTREVRAKEMYEAYLDFDKEVNVSISLDVEKLIYNRSNNIDDIHSDVLKVVKKSKSLTNKINKLRKELSSTDEGVLYNSYMDNHEFFNKKIEEYNLLLTKLNKDFNVKQGQRDRLIKVINNEEKKLLANDLDYNAMVVKQKALEVIVNYNDVKRVEIIKEVEVEALNILNNFLMRKKGYISGVEIKDDEILIYSPGGLENLKYISSGEKQVFIVALVLSIIKVAKVDLSLVLDTFIGRLDPIHTKNLLNFLSKEIDNQILILTTSSEISDVEKEYIKGDLSCIYNLEYNDLKTNIIKEYDAN